MAEDSCTIIRPFRGGRGETPWPWTISTTEGAKDLENYVHIHKSSIPTGKRPEIVVRLPTLAVYVLSRGWWPWKALAEAHVLLHC